MHRPVKAGEEAACTKDKMKGERNFRRRHGEGATDNKGSIKHDMTCMHEAACTRVK